MRERIILLLALILSATAYNWKKKTVCATNQYQPDKLKPIKFYEVDLDAAPKDRWTAIVTEYQDGIKELLNAIIELVQQIPYGNDLIELLDKEGPGLLSTFPPEYAEEMQGIADATGLEVGQVVVYNIFYELFTVCTSIVAQTSSGERIHARNLDFGLFLGWDLKTHTWKVSEILRTIVLNVNFMKNGKLFYKETTFAGYIGVFSAVKNNSFGLTINERFSVNGGYIGLIEYYLLHKTNQAWTTWMTRDIMEKGATFDQAKTNLSTQAMISPAYFILSGPSENEGTIITRSRSKSLKPKSLNPEAGVWYLLQTNYDWWKNPPYFDNRRTPGEQCMNKSTPATVSKSTIFDVLSTDPVLNQLTVYTVLINPQTGELESYIRSCPTCYPW